MRHFWPVFAGKGLVLQLRSGGTRSRRALFLVVGTTCAFVAAIVAVTEWEDRARRLDATRQEAVTLARLLEEQTAGMLWATDLALLAIAESLRRDAALPIHDPEFEGSLRRLLRNLPLIRALFVIGPDGFIVQDTDRDTPRRNLADRDYFRAHVDDPGRGLFIGQPLVSRSVGTWFVGVSRRIEDANGHFAGVVTAAMETRNFERFYEGLGLQDGDVITLATRDASLVARWPPADDRVGKPIVNPTQSLLVAALVRAPSGTFEAVSAIDGEARIYGYRSLAQHPLVVLVGLSRDSVLAPWRRSVAVSALSTFAAIALAALLLWLAMRQARRETEVQARVTEAAKLETIGRITSGVAHDFNNLLQAMRAALHLLAQRTRSDAQASQVIEQGISSIERGRSLVSQLLGLARPQALQAREIDLNQLLTEISGLLRNAAAPAAQIELDLAADLNPCHADPPRLEAAILNLVVNARDATPADRRAGGRIRISTMNCDETAVSIDGQQLEPGQFVRLTVRDDGIGMPPVVMERASEPFFTTKGDRGTGLGLAQVYGFMREVGGGMQIESAPHAGTAVHLYLPAQVSSSRGKTVVETGDEAR